MKKQDKEGTEEYLTVLQTPAKKIKMTEAIMQYVLFMYGHFRAFFPNITLGCNEWDGIHISKAGYATCYEIKLSKSDFKADFKKPRHALLLNRLERDPDNKYISLGLLPKHVYYVIHGFNLDVEDVPEYAGLIVVGKHGTCDIVKQAPVLWKEKLSDKQMAGMYKIMGKRYIYRTAEGNKKFYDEWRNNESIL